MEFNALEIPRFLENKFLLVDFEGYFYFGQFFFKEFGFYEYNTINTLYIKTKPLKFSNYLWLLKHSHRIPSHFGTEPFKAVLEILNKENHTILVKGIEKTNILKNLTNNQVINLESLDCPAFKALKSNDYPCLFHSIVPSVHCVRIKISKILNWLKNESRLTQITNRLA